MLGPRYRLEFIYVGRDSGGLTRDHRYFGCMKHFLIFAIAILFLSSGLSAQKLKPEEIIGRSLDAIGTTDARGKIANITMIGDSGFNQGSSVGFQSSGRVAISSEGNKTLLAMSFAVPAYPLERFTWDGKVMGIAYIRPGTRSALGDFLASHDGIIKEGLLSGVLNKGWPLFDLAFRDPKLSFDGTKKIDGKEAYVLGYSPKHSSDVRIKLYFDKATFRHIRTEYLLTISAQMGADPNLSASQTENHKNLTEDFSDFKTENGLTLPRTYRLFYHNEEGKASRDYYYTLKLKDFYFNQALEPGTFAPESK